jgi:hypothetical protein
MGDRDKCSSAGCGICRSGWDYRAMRWSPEPLLCTRNNISESENSEAMAWWFIPGTDELENALTWPGP